MAESGLQAQDITFGTSDRMRKSVFLIAALLIAASGSLGYWTEVWAHVLGGLLVPGRGGDLANSDFVNYWFGARLAVSGDQEVLFFGDRYFAALTGHFGGGLEYRNWSYPPHALLFLWPLAFLPLPVAFAAFLALGAVVYVAGMRRFAETLPMAWDRTALAVVAILISPYLVTQFALGQNGFWFAGLMLLALAYRSTRPVLAGLFIALLTLKPQLGILLPVLLVVERRWAVITAAALFTVAILALAGAIFGFQSYALFFANTVPDQKAVMLEWVGVFLRLMPTLFAWLRLAGVDPAIAVMANLVLSGAVFVAALWCLARARSEHARSMIFIAATALVTPYLFLYDLGAVVCAAAIVVSMRWKQAGGMASPPLAVAALVCFLPLFMPVRTAAPVLAPVLQAVPMTLLMAFFVAATAGRLSRAEPTRSC